MICVPVNAQAASGVPADYIVGKHALNCLLNDKFGLCSHKSCVADLFEVADIACVAIILLLLELLAGQDDLAALIITTLSPQSA